MHAEPLLPDARGAEHVALHAGFWGKRRESQPVPAKPFLEIASHPGWCGRRLSGPPP